MCLTDAMLTMAAFTRYGKSRHAAQLNFGCFRACALAKSLTMPFLYKGNDFEQIDVSSALA